MEMAWISVEDRLPEELDDVTADNAMLEYDPEEV